MPSRAVACVRIMAREWVGAMKSRTFALGCAGALLAAALGVVSYSWWTHRRTSRAAALERERRLEAASSDCAAHREEILTEARLRVLQEDWTLARIAMDRCEGVEDAELLALRERVRIGSSASRALAERVSLAAGRLQIAEARRNLFLDAGLDVQVEVSGKENEVILCSYVIFNDVWARRFEKSDELLMLKAAGFKRFPLTDGYRWSREWDLRLERR